MSPLFETIKVKDRKFFNLDFHNARMNAARKELFGCNDVLDLKHDLYIPKSVGTAVHKCKVIYNKDVISIHFQPYYFKKIQSLKVVHADDIDYRFKSTDRNYLNQLYSQKENCDDVLIVKNDLITDTSYANIIFFDGKKWVTPKSPLLKGTKRAKLLKERKVEEQKITIQMLSKFKEAKVINAMINIENMKSIPIQNITK